MKTLVYFASGLFNDFDKIDKIDYDRIILIDYEFDIQNSKFKKISPKILILKMDAMEAVRYLIKNKIKIDCFMSLNEGLEEGGGDYPLNGFYFLSYLSPILESTYYHIYDPSYYKNIKYSILSTRMAFLNHSFSEECRVEIEAIGIPIDSFRGLENAICLKMQRKKVEVFKSKKFKSIEYIKGNIWDSFSKLNLLVMPKNKLHHKFIGNDEKMFIFQSSEFPHEQFQRIKLNEGATIGMLLWFGENYDHDFSLIDQWAIENKINIKVFFPQEKDLVKLN